MGKTKHTDYEDNDYISRKKAVKIAKQKRNERHKREIADDKYEVGKSKKPT